MIVVTGFREVIIVADNVLGAVFLRKFFEVIAVAIIAEINMDFLLVWIFHLRTSFECLGEKFFVFVVSCDEYVDVRIIFVFDLWCFWRNLLWAENMPEVDAKLERFDKLHDDDNQTEYNVDCIKIKWHCEGEAVSDINDSRGQRDKIY